jgi:hypothetical protein
LKQNLKFLNQRSLVVGVIDALGLPLSLEVRVVDDLKNEKQTRVGQNFIEKNGCKILFFDEISNCV